MSPVPRQPNDYFAPLLYDEKLFSGEVEQRETVSEFEPLHPFSRCMVECLLHS